MKKMKNDFSAIMELLMILWPIIKEWLEGRETVGITQEQIIYALQMYEVKNARLMSSPAYKTDSATEIMALFNPPEQKFGGILEEIAKIGQIIDAIIEILKKLFPENEPNNE